MAPVYNKKGVRVRPATWMDVERMADCLRDSDKEEIRASTGLEPKYGLRHSFFVSESKFVITHNQCPAVMFGVLSIIGSKDGCVWMLATDRVKNIKQSVYTISVAYINYFLGIYEVLYNFIDERNTRTEKWLRLCGARFYNSLLLGPEGKVFKYFQFEKMA